MPTVGRRSLTLAVRLGAALDEVDAVLREQLERLDHERVDITHSPRLPRLMSVHAAKWIQTR